MGSEASEVGLRSGWAVGAIDGEDMVDVPLPEIMHRLQVTPPGSGVVYERCVCTEAGP